MQLNFDARSVQPDEGRAGPFPAGWYAMAVTETEIKPTKGGTGVALSATMTVLDGQHKGRKVFTNFNIQNASEEAQRIGHAQLSALCHATGMLVLQDSQQLHNLPFKAKIKIRPAEGQYEATNEVSAYRNVNDPSAVDTAPAPAAPSLPQHKPGVPAGNPAQAVQAMQNWNNAPAQAPQQSQPQQAPQQQQWAAPASPQPWEQQQAPQNAPPQQFQAPQQQQFQAPQQAPQFAQPAGFTQPQEFVPQQHQQQQQQQQAPQVVTQGQTAVPPWMK